MEERPEDIEIYKKINEYIKSNLIVSYEKEILEYLSTHKLKDSDETFFKTLNSIDSIGKCYRFCRYLVQALKNKKYILCEGKLKSLYSGEFEHAWIECGDSVYDVSFIGIWPKKLFYDLFQPIVEKKIDHKDIDNDEKYAQYLSNTITIKQENKKVELHYIDWYEYSTRNGNFYRGRPFWYKLPESDIHYTKEQDSKVNINPNIPAEIENIIDNNTIQKIWMNYSFNNDIPSELFSEELKNHFKKNNYIKDSMYLYTELIKFIVTNRELYEEKKHLVGDISLWKKAIELEYTGSFCELISHIPEILNTIELKTTIKK